MKNNNLLNIYNDLVISKKIRFDQQQKLAIQELQVFYDYLIKINKIPLLTKLKMNIRNFFIKLIFNSTLSQHSGLYLWGGVGRGKTFLMDIFFENLAIKSKLRVHFHKFMQQVHEKLSSLNDKKNPLYEVAAHFSKNKVICLDELFVKDIADAMILEKLFQILIKNGVILIFTSNLHPDELYKDGLQRKRFLPAIELLKKNLNILNIDSGIDYRLQIFKKISIFHISNDKEKNKILDKDFHKLALGEIKKNENLNICSRKIKTIALADDIVWFSFKELCVGFRSQLDYLEIAKNFHTVFISDIYQISDSKNDIARRFINLIDILYDHKVKLLLTSSAPINKIYIGYDLAFEFERIVSRLEEMQTEQYIAKAHLV